MSYADIPLIPIPYQKPSKGQKAAFGKQMRTKEEAEYVKDRDKVRKASRSFEQKVAEDLKRLGINA